MLEILFGAQVRNKKVNFGLNNKFQFVSKLNCSCFLALTSQFGIGNILLRKDYIFILNSMLDSLSLLHELTIH